MYAVGVRRKKIRKNQQIGVRNQRRKTSDLDQKLSCVRNSNLDDMGGGFAPWIRAKAGQLILHNPQEKVQNVRMHHPLKPMKPHS